MRRQSGVCLIIALALGLASPTIAQIRPLPGGGDPHLQTIEFRADQVVAIDAALGYQVTIELASDEQIESAAVGDSTAWQVTNNAAGNRLFVKPLQAGLATNLTVVTNVRGYSFQLTARPELDALTPYVVTFRYPTAAAQGVMTGVDPAGMKGRYRLSGDRALRPAGISDDGIHTFIEWPEDVALPATYFLDKTGRESLANGRMQQGIYVVDGVGERLIFRIDRQVARATRIASPKGDQ